MPRSRARMYGGLLALGVSGCRMAGVEQRGPSEAADSATVAFVGAEVVPMDREVVLHDQTVVVQGGRVIAMGDRSAVEVPKGAVRVRASGQYLMPALTDAHVHVGQRDDLVLYLANGVTSVWHMGGSGARVLAWRDSVRSGLVRGPTIYVGFYIDGAGRPGGVADTASARAAIVRADSAGYDFVKVYNSLTVEQYEVVLDEARRRSLSVLGHGVRSVGLERGFAAGQIGVVHAEEYIYTDWRQRSDSTLFGPAAAFTKRAGAYVTPNLSAYDAMTRQWGRPDTVEAFLARPEAVYQHPAWKSGWRARDYARRAGSIEQRNRALGRFTKVLSDSGVPLLTGTDSPGIPGMYAGYSLHEELRLLVANGLTPYQALAAATSTAGRFAVRAVSGADTAGVVRPGARADLLLVDGNPLRDVTRVGRPLGVMAGGVWYPRPRVQAMLDSLATAYGARAGR